MDRNGDPAAGWERMREFCSDIVALRRGEYRAQRLEFERERAGLAGGCELATRKSPEPADKNVCPTPAKEI